MNKANQFDLNFNSTKGFPIGVEVECQILDPSTGGLVPGAIPLLKACEREKIGGVSAEFMQSMIEIKTGVCANASEAREQLIVIAKKVDNIATSMGYILGLSSTHPFNRSMMNSIFPAPRYERLRERLAWIASHDLVFGLHVHIGVPDGDTAIGLINNVVQYLPHMIGLSANSPFWQGADTGLASFRSASYGIIPHTGVPPYFKTWRDFKNYYQVMLKTGVLYSLKDIHWDIRPRPDLGTIEVRVFDVPSTFSEIISLVAFIRTLVISTFRLLQEHPRLHQGDKRRQWIAIENKWLAIRYGLAGMYIRTISGKKRSLLSDTAELIEHLMPIARESGDDKYLRALQPLNKIESGAERQRRIYRESGNWKALIEDMRKQFLRDLNPPRQWSEKILTIVHENLDHT